MIYTPQNICEAFHGGGESWEIVDALRRVESRIMDAVNLVPFGSAEESGYYDALSSVRRLRLACEHGWPPFDDVL